MKTHSSFKSFDLHPAIQKALIDLGFESPSPIQSQSIPLLLAGKDLIAQAQTGTGKTAAFALPILQHLDLESKDPRPQALILTPTRELALQVAEALQLFAKYLPNFHIVPIYGGQDYPQQLKALKRGVQVVVGTPGRIMDHMRRESLQLSRIRWMVLDEADEMLRMGFLEDVKWILEQIPQDHQAALFSATMPNSIARIAESYLNAPERIKVAAKSLTGANISQNAMLVSQKNKVEALTRYLEIEELDAALIFARTKNMAAELADKLAARGYAAACLHGDMSQAMREKVIERVKGKSLDLIVATDVAARGLDVERITHVINFDPPYDAETYTHRIGRTGRAGRSGKSLLILTPRERHFLRDIERATNQAVLMIDPPSVNHLRKSRFDNLVAHAQSELNKGGLDSYRELVLKMAHILESPLQDIASVLLKLAQLEKPLLIEGELELLTESKEQSPKHGKQRRPHRPGSRPGSRTGGRRSSGRSESRPGGSRSGGRSDSRPGGSRSGSRSDSRPGSRPSKSKNPGKKRTEKRR